MLSLRAAGIVSTVLAGILYGLSVFMAALSVLIMFRYRRKQRVKPGMIAAGCALLIFATAETGVNTARLYQGFLTVGPYLLGGPEAYFADVSQATFITKSCLYNAQTLILDGVVIYRVFVVWQDMWAVVFPIMGWLGQLAVSIGLNISLVTAGSHKGNIFATETGSWITANFCLTLGTNLSSTVLLVFKIWSISRQSAQYRSNSVVSPTLRVIIESGAIYSMTITIALVLFAVKSPAQYILLDLISPIISIVFNMLFIHVGISSRNAFTPSQTTVGTGQSTNWRKLGRSGGRLHGVSEESYIMQDIKVEITETVEHDSNGIPDTCTNSSKIPLELESNTLNNGSSGPRACDISLEI